MTLDEFSRRAAKEYLHSVVFVDDQIYDARTDHPLENSAIAPRFKSAFSEQETSQTELPPTALEVAPVYHPKQLMESFARKGMVCALYEPQRGFSTDPESDLFRLCARADVVILDWDLYNEDGRNLLPLITNLIREGQKNTPHHVRLFAIYTSKPNLFSLGDALLGHLTDSQIQVTPVHPLTFIAGATRIVVLGKPDGIGRTPESKDLEVREHDLADRIIEEFSIMNRGILPSFALHGLACIRRNAKRILDKFRPDMDGPFLLHRASLLEHEDAFEQFPELLAEEALAVMLDEQISHQDSSDIANNEAETIILTALKWPPIGVDKSLNADSLARSYLANGPSVLKGKVNVKGNPPFDPFHQAMGCDNTHGHERLAALFNVRTHYFRGKPPELGFGTVIRSNFAGAQLSPEYRLCLMPICDGIRLRDGAQITFPFWKMSLLGGRAGGRGLVLEVNENEYVTLRTSGKPRDMLWLEKFTPNGSGSVSAEETNGIFTFSGVSGSFEWVAQLKPAHAQRIAHDIGQSLSRVGVVEAEWLRRMTDKT